MVTRAESSSAAAKQAGSGLAPLVEVRDLTVDFTGRGRATRAVDGVSLTIAASERVALVGESGSGKSATALAMMGLIPAVAGEVLIEGANILRVGERRLRDYRGKVAAMIFQDPGSSLNPLFTIAQQLGDVLVKRMGMRRDNARRRAVELLGEVGIPDAAQRIDDYPHQFSGGMRQRVMLAMALAFEPRLLIADEPTTALDVTIQAQVLDLIRRLTEERAMALLLITHDFGVVAGLCTQANVMYAGRIVESAPTEALFATPEHPYSIGLLGSMPRLTDRTGPAKPRLASIPGQPPQETGTAGCPFVPRCFAVQPGCHERAPELGSSGPARRVSCWHPVRHGATEPPGES